jgi:predicted protein tyrosine phosphatase
MLLQRGDADVCAVISIAGAREHRVACEVPYRLDLSFDDVEVPDPNDVISMHRVLSRRRFAEANGLRETPPTIEDARAIIAFAKKVADLDGILLIHCGAGMSRAPAAGLICLATWLGPGLEAEAIAELRRCRPSAVPHAGLVRFGDDSLDRKGLLLSTL